MDHDGYPASYTISGDGIIKGVHDKVDVEREIFASDKSVPRHGEPGQGRGAG
ncbi:hypothetical protein LP417_35570 (plasmid) [Polaromonas sp. P1-6]|nr:hypothetical protein LP417_35570 [Polaromonas sp. P1-6]